MAATPHIEVRLYRWLRGRLTRLRAVFRDLEWDPGTAAPAIVGAALPWFWAAIMFAPWPVDWKLAGLGLSFVIAGLALFIWGAWLATHRT